ncbi:MAG: ABC transporter ATP-binding protein, partial [Clostridia bacterium]|nr:ABC transporter ATP-binding protein [Clostridia bacterium]
MNEQSKPRYNIAQNVVWMIRTAWKTRKRVLLFCVLTAGLEILYNLTQLYIAPKILERVDMHAPLPVLIGTVLVFTAALFLILGFRDYIKENTLFPRVDVRSAIIGMIAYKSNTTSYLNTLDAQYLKLRDKAHAACEGNREATEYIWDTVTRLLQGVGGFLVYLFIMSRLNGVLIAVVIATCAVGFFVSRYANSWIFAHRDESEKYFLKVNYIRRKAESVELAKDIRIFGFQNWLNDIMDSVYDAYLSFRMKVERKRLAADATEAALIVARNGIAYVYLINMA